MRRVCSEREREKEKERERERQGRDQTERERWTWTEERQRSREREHSLPVISQLDQPVAATARPMARPPVHEVYSQEALAVASRAP